MRTILARFAIIGILAITATARAQQQGLRQPEASPAASLSQTIGLTEIKVSYHRPAVAGRAVWGSLVPWDHVWRAGANENTTVSFSTAVKVAGQPLAAGTYGLHTIPSQKQWTVIFSHQSGAWGSYGYDPKEDALRVVVKPAAGDSFVERLAYTFDDPGDAGVTLALRWEKLKLPIPITVDTPAVVIDSMREELRGAAQFSWLPWAQAARWWLAHGGNLDEAQRFADKSIAMQETFVNLDVRADIADKRGDAAGAAKLRERAFALATENDLNQLGYRYFLAKKLDEAIAIFRKNVAAHPQSWNAHDSLGEALLARGDKKGAAESYTRALALIQGKNDSANEVRIQDVLAKLKAK